jgi:hypothetical protein
LQFEALKWGAHGLDLGKAQNHTPDLEAEGTLPKEKGGAFLSENAAPFVIRLIIETA